MANFSNTEIELNGSKENIKLCKEEIQRHLEENEYGVWLSPLKYKTVAEMKVIEGDITLESGYSLMLFNVVEEELTFKDTSIGIYGQGRGCSPYLYIQDLVKKYSLSGYMFDMECGNQWCSLQEFENGEIVKDITENNHFCQLSIGVKGIDYWVDNMYYMFEELECGEYETFEEWYEWYEGELELFEKNGYPLQKLLDKYEININKIYESEKKVGVIQ